MLTVNRFLLKSCVVMVGACMLNACQSTQSTPATKGVINDSAKALFENSEQSLSYQAKEYSIKALLAYLNNERYVVSTTYSQVSPTHKSTSIDNDADNIWTTIAKTNEYRQNQLSSSHKDTAFRRAVDYLYPADQDVALGLDLGELPYLRYDDEMANRTVNTVTRLVGMSDEYQSTNDDISDLRIQATCLSDIFDKLDQLILKNPNIDHTDKQIKALQQPLAKCQKTLNDNAQTLLKTAQGYQIDDIKHLQQCVNTHTQGLKDIMRPNRTPKKLDGSAYEHYQALNNNYKICTQQSGHHYQLEPYRYTQGSSEKRLQALTGIKSCYHTAWQEQQNLQKQGKSYQHHAQDYAQSYDNYAKCSIKALHDISGDDELLAFENPKDYEVFLETLNDRLYDLDNTQQNHRYSGLDGWFYAYKDMKSSKTTKFTEQNSDNAPTPSPFGFYGSMVSSMLDYIKKTPEQLQAQNLYQYNNSKLTSLSHYRPDQKHAQILWSFDFSSATAKQSTQLPVQVDFNQGKMIADVSAALPLLAAIDPKNAPLPKDIPDGKMFFELPENLRKQIPSDVIYQALIDGIIAGYREIESEKFTPVDISQDKFAKEIGAKRGIKLEFTTKEAGKIYAIIAKHVVWELKNYVDSHPELYPDTKATKDDPKNNLKKGDTTANQVKKWIDNFAIINKGYQSSDVGGLLQMIEGIAPMSFNASSYWYFNHAGKLIGSQTITSVNEYTNNTRTQSVNQQRYDKAFFDAHPLSQNFHDSFSTSAFASFDGGAWLQERWLDYKLQKQARFARYQYNTAEAVEAEKQGSQPDTNDNGQ